MTLFETAILKAIWAGFRYLSESSNTRPLVEWVGEHSETGPVVVGTAYPPRTFKAPDPPPPPPEEEEVISIPSASVPSGEVETGGTLEQAPTVHAPPADNPGPPKRRRGRPRKNGTG
tara:strand:+ start:172 stop:522 length:351 start_codon:yes stop_codon:yes gene_type:complete